MAGDEGKPLTHDKDLGQFLRLHGVREADLRLNLAPSVQPVAIIEDRLTVTERLALPEAWFFSQSNSQAGVHNGFVISAHAEIDLVFMRVGVNSRLWRTTGIAGGGALPIFYTRSQPRAVVELVSIAPAALNGCRFDTGQVFPPAGSIVIPRGEQLVIVANAVATAVELSAIWREVPSG